MAWRNIYYDTKQQVIHLWTWDKNGKRVKTVHEYEPYLYIESATTRHATSIFQTALKKLTFKNQFERSRFVNETPIKRLFHNLSCEQDFLLTTYKDDINKIDFGLQPLKTFYYDIETYSPGGFPDPNKAPDPINLITLYDSISKQFHTWGLGKYKPKLPNVTYYSFTKETEMLQDFVSFWEKDPPDIMVGWNSEGFDVPYIMNRLHNLLGAEEAARLSPVQSLFYRENVGINKFGKVVNRWYIRGVSNIDYMEVYRTFTRGDRESYALGYIGELELGVGKVDTGGANLADLSKKNWDLFTDYNIHDVKLLVDLDEKLKLISLVRNLSYKGFIPFEQSLGKVSMITGAVAHQAAMQGYVIPTFKNESHRDEYVGGYVHEPERGLCRGVVSYDANSLYPNTIISLNMSPETKIGKVTAVEDGQYTIKLANEKIVTLPEEKYLKLLQREQLAISKYQVLYTQKFKGVIPNLIDRLYKERVDAKKEMIKREKSLPKITDPVLKQRTEDEILNLDTQQNVYKLVLNSIYGVFAQKYSPLFDIDHSASITLTGQAVVKEAADIAYRFAVNKGYQGKKEDIYKYGDTDSFYGSIQPVLDLLNIPLTENGELTEAARGVAKELDTYLNNEILEWAKVNILSTDPRFVFKQETICDVALFIEKKRYILHILDKEGYKPKSPFKYVGVEVARSSISNEVKTLIKSVVESVMLIGDKKKSNEIYREAFATFKNMPIDEVSLRSKISDLEKQEAKMDDFGGIGKGTPIHAKASIHYNALLKTLGIDHVYEAVSSGQKMKYFYAAKNRYNYKVMGFSNDYPEEFKEIIGVNYPLMFDKLVSPLIKKVYECIGWNIPSVSDEVQTDLFDLFA